MGVKATEIWAPKSNTGESGIFPIVGLLLESAVDSARDSGVSSIADWFIWCVFYLALSGLARIRLDGHIYSVATDHGKWNERPSPEGTETLSPGF